MSSKNLTSKEYWDGQQSNFEPFIVGNTEFSNILDKLLPINEKFKCIEIGAYPGRYLCYFAKKFKYHPTAIEYSDNADDIKRLLEYNKVDDFEVINKDFFEVEDLEFDVVSSFGFIEHFENYRDVIKRHFDLLKKGGYLVISVPYAGGLQRALRKLALKDDCYKFLWKIHNEKIMELNALKKSVLEFTDEILYANYVTGFKMWVSSKSPNLKDNMRWLIHLANIIDRSIGEKVPSSKIYSPCILLVARKS